MQRLTRDEFRDLSKLRERSARDERGLLLVPGIKCCRDYLASGGLPERILLREDRLDLLRELQLDARLPAWGNLLRSARDQDLARLGEQKQPEGVIIVGPKQKSQSLMRPQVILDGLADLGNLGAVIRSALWFGISRIWLLEPAADPWSPRGIRASMGAIFRLDCCHTTTEAQLRQELAGSGCRLLFLEADGETDLHRHEFQPEDIIVLGGESHGIRLARELCSAALSIPGSGSMDSLNAGHAFAVCAWERLRQGIGPQ